MVVQRKGTGYSGEHPEERGEEQGGTLVLEGVINILGEKMSNSRGENRKKNTFLSILTGPANLVTFQKVSGKSLWFSSIY